MHTTKQLLTFFVSIIFSSIFTFELQAQLVINEDYNQSKKSLHEIASYIEIPTQDFDFKFFNTENYVFKSLPHANTDLGFTTSNYVIKFDILNTTANKERFFLETSRPIIDVATLYQINSKNDTIVHKSGDLIPFHQRSFQHRKTIFDLKLESNEVYKFYLHLKSDGEVIDASLNLYTFEYLLSSSAFEQIIFGFFYGILCIAGILYLFFYFGMKTQSFLYYALYVLAIGLMQFALDGYFYEFLTPNAGWFSNRSVLIFALISAFFLGKYAEVFLNVNQYSKSLAIAFKVHYVAVSMLFLGLLIFDAFLPYVYPLANVLGLYVLILIIIALFKIYNVSKYLDVFFTTGIFFLVIGFVIFILKNFSVIPLNFWTENSSKLGTGIEIIFLSLSMANLIKKMRDEREKLQALALQKSEEMNELKSYFLSNISHELRTPLNAILSVSAAIKEESEDQTIRQNCDAIQYSSKSLLSAVDDILDFSKIEKGQLVLEHATFDLRNHLNFVIQSAAARAKDQGIDFHININNNVPQKAVGDANRVAQILQNILSNAIKFTPKGCVKCNVDYDETISKTLIINVIDTGVGIPKEKINAIYDSFSQESINNKRKFGGLGLGLYIVKNLVKLFEGTIHLQSEVGVGTICTVSLPLQAVSETLTIKGESKALQTNHQKILVVEDNAMNQMVIKMMTKKWENATFTYANHGQEAIDLMKKDAYDLILMDLQMPVLDGYETTIAIRNGEVGLHNMNIPIIAVTADVMESTKQRVKTIGMNAYLSKPLDKQKLLNTIEDVLVSSLHIKAV